MGTSFVQSSGGLKPTLLLQSLKDASGMTQLRALGADVGPVGRSALCGSRQRRPRRAADLRRAGSLGRDAHRARGVDPRQGVFNTGRVFNVRRQTG